MAGDECDRVGSRGEANKLFELWNWRGSKCQWVINKSSSLPVDGWSERCITLIWAPLRQLYVHQENKTTSYFLCVWVSVQLRSCVWSFVITLNTSTGDQCHGGYSWKLGSLVHWSPIGRHIFPELSVCLRVCMCLCVYVWCNVGDQHCYELVSSGPHVLFGAEPAQSTAVTRSPGADFTLREEVLVYSFWTLLLTSLFFRLSDPVIEVTLVQKLLRSSTGCHRVVFSLYYIEMKTLGVVTGVFVISSSPDDVWKKTQKSHFHCEAKTETQQNDINAGVSSVFFSHYIMWDKE